MTSIAYSGSRNAGGCGRCSSSQRRQYSRNSACSGVSRRFSISCPFVGEPMKHHAAPLWEESKEPDPEPEIDTARRDHELFGIGFGFGIGTKRLAVAISVRQDHSFPCVSYIRLTAPSRARESLGDLRGAVPHPRRD